GHVGAVVPGRVLDDRIELALGVAVEPATAVIDDNVDLGIVEQAGDHRVFLDDLQIARVDLDDGGVLDRRMAGDHLLPGAGSQADQQHVLGIWMIEAEREGTDEQVLVIHQVDGDTTVVHAVAIGVQIRIDGDDAAAVLDDFDEFLALRHHVVRQQALVEPVEQKAGRQHDRADGAHAEGHEEPAPLAGQLAGQRDEQGYADAEHAKQLGNGCDRQVVHEDEAGGERADDGTQNVGNIDRAD